MNLQIVKQAMKENKLQYSHVDWLIEQVVMAQGMERNYTHQLAEIARLSDVVCPFVLDQEKDFRPIEVLQAAEEIMQYVEAVRPGEEGKETKWAVHIIGPDDIHHCRGEFDALRRANQHNICFAKIMAEDPLPNDPYCVAVAEQI